MFAQATPVTPHVVMGIDPGLTRCGYAILEMTSQQNIRAVAIGVVRTPPSSPLHERLAEIHGEVESLLTQFQPHAVAIEQVFFQNNVRTAMSVGQASGIVLALASRAGCVVAQYTPSQVKNTIVGWGSATKDQIGRMVQQRLHLASIPEPADAADAAAIALCHCAIAPFIASRDAAIARSAR
ncbi:MAG: crossover junction endodeoxyribonuclease RuvC [Actinomycetota bacterium]|jgi:crossover junction endodeoxyribonuclease RuvC